MIPTPILKINKSNEGITFDSFKVYTTLFSKN